MQIIIFLPGEPQKGPFLHRKIIVCKSFGTSVEESVPPPPQPSVSLPLFPEWQFPFDYVFISIVSHCSRWRLPFRPWDPFRPPRSHKHLPSSGFWKVFPVGVERRGTSKEFSPKPLETTPYSGGRSWSTPTFLLLLNVSWFWKISFYDRNCLLELPLSYFPPPCA